jgi:DNA (cytosine-5)-methyltransferase 1
MTLTHGSLFSGVGGFDLGADAAGIETLWQAEIDKKASSVLARHWPNATRYGDVKEVKGDQVKPVDIISFGSPCQDLSIAGKGAGLQGSRSGLFFEAIRIIKEMRDATQNQYPQIAIWENVRGALSSNEGKDFHAAIQALAKLGAVDISYRLVNACHFGVPQRRVRVFVVADFGGERAGQILSKPTRLLWHPPQSGESGEETTREVEGRSQIGGWTTSGLVSAVCSKWAKGTGGPSGSEHYNLVLESQAFDEYNGTTNDIHHTLRAGTKQSTGVVSYVKSRRAHSKDDYETWVADQPAPTLNGIDNSSESVATVIAFSHVNSMDIQPSQAVWPTLRVGSGGNAVSEATDQISYRVRRLTPVECERLMGWPDNHTKYDKDDNELSDSARYKMCGNGIVAPVAQWLCENIVKELT